MAWVVFLWMLLRARFRERVVASAPVRITEKLCLGALAVGLAVYLGPLVTHHPYFVGR